MKNFLSKLWSLSRTDRVRTLAIDAVSLPSFCRVNMLKLVSVLVILLTIGSGNVWGAEETISFATYSTSGTSGNNDFAITWTGNTSCNIKQEKGTGTKVGNYTTAPRWYQNNTITITPKGGATITKLVITGGDSKYGQTFTCGSGTVTNTSRSVTTITGNWTSAFTISPGSQCRFGSIVVTYSGSSSCSECTYYVYNGSTWVSIGTTGFDDVVLAPPTLPDNNHGAGNGCWVTDKNIYDGGGCVTYTSGDKYRYVPNPGGDEPDADNKPGSGTCELYAVYAEANGCLSTTVTAVQCARIWKEPENLSVTSVTSSGATLNWDAMDGVSSYHVTVTKSGGSTTTYDVNTNSKTLTGLAPGTYSWTVAANSPTNDACDSNPTDGDDFVIESCTDISGSTVSSANISVTPAKTTATISWSAVANASSYEVKVYAGATASGVAVWTASPDPTSTSCTATGLTANTQYTVAIKAKNACSTSSTAGTKTFTTQNLTLYHIDFVNQNNTSSHPAQLEQTSEGQNLDIPANSGGNVTAPSAACSSADWTFAGWKVGSAQSETTSAPSLVAAGTTGYAMDGNKTFYAVFTKTEGGGGTPKTTLLSSTCADAENFTDEDWPTKDTYYLNDPAGALRLGKSRGVGSITSKSLPATVGTTIKVDFDARAYNLDDGGNINVNVSGCDQQSVLWATYGGSTSDYTSCSLSFVTTTASFTVTIATSSKRAVLKNIEIYYGGGGSSTTYWNSNPSCSSEATVTYHNDGAKSGAAPTDANSPYTIGDNVTVLGTGTMVAPDGKEFKCWNTASDGTGTDYNIGAKFDIAGNMDFYPKWVNAPYTVTFDAEGGTCGTSSLTEASGGAGVVLPAATAPCSTAGWSFYGWATSASTSTTSAPTTVGTTGATYYPTSAITLHAIYVNSGTYNSNPVCHEVTIGSHSNGTVNVNSSTTSPQSVTQGATVNIAATPSGGYNFTTWTITKTTGGNDVTSTLLGANATTASTSFTMPDYDVTVSATFTAKVMCTITWNVNGSTYTTGGPSDEAESGTKWSALTLPTAPADNTLSDCDRTKFVGWSTSQLFGDGNSAPSDLFKSTSDDNADSHTITAATTFYAVFAKGSGSETKWVRVEAGSVGFSLASISEGTYALVDADGYAFNGTISSGHGQSTGEAATFTSNEAEEMPDGYCELTFTKVMSGEDIVGYTMYNASHGYLYAQKAGSGQLAWHATETSYWYYYGSNWEYKSNNATLRTYNHTFRTYSNSSNNSLWLAKKTGGSSSFTDYATQCCTLKPVTNLAVSSTTANSVTLTWTAPSPTTGIDHLELRNASTDAKIGSDIAVGTTTTSVSGLVECNTYSYKIVSVGAVCETPSDVVEATPYSGSKTVTFNYNGGTGTPASFTTSCGGTSTILPTPTRDGYTFLGWWTAADGGSKVGDAGANYDVATTTTIHAHWAQNFTVTYNRKGGTIVCGGSEIGVAGQTFTICTTEPTRSGYIFAGWDTEEGGTGTRYNAGGTFTMPSSDVTLYAQWTANWRNLTFNVPTGGGSITGGPAGNHVLDNQTFTFPNITGKSDSKWCWTFLGWTETAPNGSGTWATTPSYIAGGATSGAITSDKTYYAVYSKTGAGASGDVECDAAAITAIGTGGGHAYADAEWTITAADLSSWKARAYVGNKGTYLQIKEDAAIYIKLPTVGGNYTSITLNHNSNSGSRTIAYRTATDGSDVATTTTAAYATSTTISIANGSTTGYIMSKSGTTTYQITSITAHFGPPTVYGYTLDDCPCVVEEFDLTYDANATNFPGSTTSCTGVTDYRWEDHDNEYTICPTEPTLEGYKFTHWATNANGSGTTYNAGEVISCVGETPITLYARYERVYTVTFNNQGATTPVTQASEGAAIAVPIATTPCDAEWAFVGWSETAIAPMSMLPTLEITAGTSTYTPTADKTLYAIYRKTSESSPFVAGMSGAYKISNGSTVYAGACNNSKLPETNAAGAYVFYITYISADGGKYTIQQADGKYLKYAGSSTSLALDEETPYYWTMTQNSSLWHVLGVGSGHYLQHSSGTGFKAYNTSGPTDIAFVAAEGQYYYRTMSCADEFDITFHDNGTTINWAGGYPEASYKDLADATVVSTFPTATYDGWTFLGWRSADYEESTTAPSASGIYSTGGNALTISSADVDLYPVFTRFEDNEPFDQINGGDYFIYYIKASVDAYGANERVYAGEYIDNKRYTETSLCAEATEFNFTKEGDIWHIYDKTKGKYIAGVVGNNDLVHRSDLSGDNDDWTISVVSGNQFEASCQGGTRRLSFSTAANYFMNYETAAGPGYLPVYLGSCTERVFTTNPSTTPHITMNGEVAPITSSQNGAVRATNVLSVSGGNLTPSTGEITITSNNSDVYFSLSADKNFAKGVADQPEASVTITANGSGVVTPTPVYVHYKPTGNTDTWTSATITASYPGAVDQTATVELRTVKENFVIAAKVAGNWYALPANMGAEGVFEPVLIDVDESAKIAYGPATVGYKMWPVQTVNGGTDEYAANGDKVRFAGNSNAGLWASNSNNHIRNWATITAIGSTAETPASYEWIIETEDREAYTLKSMYSTNYLDLYRPSNGAHAGKLVWASNSTYETNEIHFFPLTERTTIDIIPREWKTNGFVFMVNADNLISAVTYKIGTGDETSTTYTRHSTGGYGLYEVALPDLTSQYGKLLTLKLTISGTPTYATVTIPIIVNANASTKTNEPFATLGAATKDYDVVVLDGKTLTTDAIASGACKFQNLYIYPGATLVNAVNNNLSVRYLELRGGIKGIDHKSDLAQGVPHLKLEKNFSSTAGANLDMSVNVSHSYALSVPFDVTVSSINYVYAYNLNKEGAAIDAVLDKHYLLMEYDGAQRASTGKGWKHITSTSRVLHAGEGYVLQAKRPTGQPFAVIRIPFSSVAGWADGSGEVVKSAVDIYEHAGGASTPDNDKGWNLIANPYMATLSYNGADEGWAADFTVGSLVKTDTDPWDGKYEWKNTTNAYVTMPNEWFTEFPQYRANSAQAVFEPFKNFFIQASADGSVTFDKSKRASAPSHLLAQVAKAQPIYADINLTHGEAFAQAGLAIDENATAGYKFGEDQNIFENREALTYLKVYTVADGHYLVGNTLTPAETAELIPLEFYAPNANGEYVFSLDEGSDIDRLEYVILYDAELNINTNLLTGSYAVELDKTGLIENRFSIGLKIKEEEHVTTGTGDVDDEAERPFKFIHNDKMYILRNGKLYDATGKMVREINK